MIKCAQDKIKDVEVTRERRDNKMRNAVTMVERSEDSEKIRRQQTAKIETLQQSNQELEKQTAVMRRIIDQKDEQITTLRRFERKASQESENVESCMKPLNEHNQRLQRQNQEKD